MYIYIYLYLLLTPCSFFYFWWCTQWNIKLHRSVGGNRLHSLRNWGTLLRIWKIFSHVWTLFKHGRSMQKLWQSMVIQCCWYSLVLVILEIHVWYLQNGTCSLDMIVMSTRIFVQFLLTFLPFKSLVLWSFHKVQVSEEHLDPSKEGQLQNLEERLTTDGYLEEVKVKFEATRFSRKTLGRFHIASDYW